MSRKPSSALLTACFAVGIVAISFSAIFIRWSAAPVSVLGMYRLLLTDLLMLPFVYRYRRQFLSLSGREMLLLSVSGLFLALHFLFWMGSLRYTSISSSTVLMSLEPIFVLFGSFFVFGERATRLALVGMGAAFAGVVVMGWGDVGLSGRALWGDVLSLLGTVAVAVHMLLGKRLRRTVSSFSYSFSVFLSAGVVFLLYNLIAGFRLTGYPPREWGLFLLLAAVPTVFGHLLFNWMLRYVRAATVSMSVLGEPIGATLLAYFLLGEHLLLRQGIAALIILAGVWLFLKEEARG